MKPRYKDKQIASIKIGNRDYSIRATGHSLERIEERNISEEIVVGNMMLLGKERLKELQEKNEDLALIDEDNQVTFIVTFTKNTLKIITVIDKTNIWVKKGTKIERL